MIPQMNPDAQRICGDYDHKLFLDFFATADYLCGKVIGNNGDISGALMDMFPEHAQKGNDSYWRLYRDWIKTDAGRDTWDTLCEQLGIDQSLYGPYFQIVFWVSW